MAEKSISKREQDKTERERDLEVQREDAERVKGGFIVGAPSQEPLKDN